MTRRLPRRPSIAQLRAYFDDVAQAERIRRESTREYQTERNDHNARVLATLKGSAS